MRFSLQRQFLLFLLVPVALITGTTIVYGFLYARENLIKQWLGGANAKLENAAREIGCRLEEKLELVDAIAKAETVPHGVIVQAYLVQRLLGMKGVKSVDFDTLNGERSDSGETPTGSAISSFAEKTRKGKRGAPSRSMNVELRVNTDYNYLDIIDRYYVKNQDIYKRITVVMDFRSLIESIKRLELWKGAKALLVTSQGLVLAHSERKWLNQRLGESGHPLEKKILKEIKRRDWGTFFGEGRPPDLVMGFHRIPHTNWYLVLYSEGCEICEPMMRFRFFFTVGNLASLGIILLVILLVTRSVAGSIREISESAAKVEQGDYSTKLPENRSDEIGLLTRSFNKMTEGLRQRDLIEQTFGRYVGREIAEELMRSPEALDLGGQEKTVTILMADLRGFTPTADKLSPHEVVTLLNRYLSRMIATIEDHGGIIVDFYGDGILAFFDSTEPMVSRRAADAVKCAIEMQRGLGSLSKENQAEGLPELKMGIGIHTGKVVVGNIGSERRAKYGIVGSPVNFTQRVQSVAAGGKIIISPQTHDKLAGSISVSQKIEVCLKGLEGQEGLFEVAYGQDVC